MERSKLLVVDDQSIFRAQFRGAVEQVGLQDRLEILEAEHGRQALDVLQNHADVAFMVVDVHMPQMDGPSMLEHLAKARGPGLGGLRVFMMTTESDPDLKARCKKLGVLAWLLKPIRPAKFLPWLQQKFLDDHAAVD